MVETFGDGRMPTCGEEGICQPIVQPEALQPEAHQQASGKSQPASEKPQPATEKPPNAAVSALPNVEITWSNSAQFAQSLQRNFSVLDLNGDGVINKIDLDERLNATGPQHSELYKLAKTIDNNYTQLTAALHKSTRYSDFDGFSSDHVKKLMEFTNPENCENSPSFAKTMGRSVAGGAIGGGVGSKIGGGEFSDGAGKGAAVGALVGILAYGLQSSQYKEFVRKRETIDNFGEFKNDTCSAQNDPAGEGFSRNEILAGDSGFDRLRENTKMVNGMVSSLPAHPLPESEVLKRFDSFKQHFDEIDSSKDKTLSYSELVEAIRSKKLSTADTALAAIIARNIDSVSRLNDVGTNTGYRVEMADLDAAQTRIFQKPSEKEELADQIMIGAAGGTGAMIGCTIGAAAGLFTTAGAASLPGCLAGAAIVGGAAGLIQWALTPKRDPLGSSIGDDRTYRLRDDLRWLQ